MSVGLVDQRRYKCEGGRRVSKEGWPAERGGVKLWLPREWLAPPTHTFGKDPKVCRRRAVEGVEA